ncbi:MAG: XdhC family protein [Bacteroidales bacterium]|nr:XdhC family protein [Bacteroidales bacterium]
MDIFKMLTELSLDGKPAALCTIINTSGSTPRKAGSKMIVRFDGKTFGSVGGGKLEVQAIEDALIAIKTGNTALKTYSSGEDNDMHCYGECQIFIDPLPNNYPLIIFGAGHVGQALAGIAGNYGFKVSIVDHREELIDHLQIEGAQLIKQDYTSAIDELDFTNKTFIVVSTPSHAFDEEVTLLCANKPHAYLGMIGSKKKVAIAKKLFAEKGLDSKSIESIDMPIGVPINCETPNEIAISILARLIDIKNQKQP